MPECARRRGLRHLSATWRNTPRPAPLPRSSPSGQAVTEFAVIVPVFLLLVIGIADLGRIYTAMSQVEAGAREAADYGAFQESNWIAANYAAVEAEMTRRACTAALGLPDYVGAADGTSCTNPTVSLPIIEGQDQNAACPTVPPIQQGLDPPCIIRVELTYTFHSVLNFPLVPGSLTFSRDSRFAVSALPVPGASTPPSPSPSP